MLLGGAVERVAVQYLQLENSFRFVTLLAIVVIEHHPKTVRSGKQLVSHL